MPLDPTAALLNDHVAVVTGAAVGIGEAIARTFARFGAHLAICDRDAEQLDRVGKEIEALGRDVLVGYLDVRDADAVMRFGSEVRTTFGHVDVVVNNAGGGFAANFLAVSGKGQDALVHENFTSVTNFVRACVPHIPPTGGSIINVTSIEAHRAGPGYAVYSAMKAAVASLTKSLAIELGHRAIRVNCIAPDLIPTPGTGHADMTAPLDVRGTADDVAGAAVFLASNLSRFVTGTTVHVDGGTWAAGGWRRADDGTFHP
jgi:NAD(P)-dependent dehydrogenase (short-subunit alcohol dehydrogenase family)